MMSDDFWSGRSPPSRGASKAGQILGAGEEIRMLLHGRRGAKVFSWKFILALPPMDHERQRPALRWRGETSTIAESRLRDSG